MKKKDYDYLREKHKRKRKSTRKKEIEIGKKTEKKMRIDIKEVMGWE